MIYYRTSLQLRRNCLSHPTRVTEGKPSSEAAASEVVNLSWVVNLAKGAIPEGPGEVRAPRSSFLGDEHPTPVLGAALYLLV